MINIIIKNLEKNLKALRYVENMLGEDTDNELRYIYSKYIDLGGVNTVASHMNDLGYRLDSPTGGRKYTPADISKLLRLENPQGVVAELDLLVKHMYNNRSRYKSWEERLVEAYYLHIEKD